MALVDMSETYQMTNVGAHIDGTDVYQSNPNLLDNWYFVGGGSQLGDGHFPINQRGQTSYTRQLAIDRWHADDTVTLYSDYLNTGNGTIYQVCDNGKITPLLGKAVTASMMLADGTIVSDTQVFPDDTNNRWVIFGSTGMASFLAGTTSQIIRLPGSNNIKAVKLELGTVSTLANDPLPDFGEELRKCQRYLWVENWGGNTPIASGIAFNTSSVFDLLTPVPMRTGAIQITFNVTPYISYGTNNLALADGASTITSGKNGNHLRVQIGHQNNYDLGNLTETHLLCGIDTTMVVSCEL